MDSHSSNSTEPAKDEGLPADTKRRDPLMDCDRCSKTTTIKFGSSSFSLPKYHPCEDHKKNEEPGLGGDSVENSGGDPEEGSRTTYAGVFPRSQAR